MSINDLKRIYVALKCSAPTHAHYDEPRQRHAEALAIVVRELQLALEPAEAFEIIESEPMTADDIRALAKYAALVKENDYLRKRLAESEAGAAALRDALECLEAEQNGAPLLGRHEKAWNAAMEKTKIALASTAPTK